MSLLNKLRWRCRRGTLELDLMLLRYLDNEYLTADPSQQQVFLQLLELEDTKLIHYFMGEVPPENAAMAALVAIIRALPA